MSLKATPLVAFLCFYLLRATCAELRASSQRLVATGQTFHALCHYERVDVDRFLYWTVHTRHNKHEDQEINANFGGVDFTTCSPFSFDDSNSILAFKTGLRGLTGQITCDLDGGPMRLFIDKVRPEYNGLRFSCTSRRNDNARSNEVTLVVGKPRLVTLEIEDSGDKNHTTGAGTVLRATCRVDRSLKPKFLFWATDDVAKNKSTFGGMVVEFCFRYKVRDPVYRRIDFNCHGPSDIASTIAVQSLPVGTAIFCYAKIDNKDGVVASRIESNRLAISDSGRFTNLVISAGKYSVPINGTFYAKCRLLSCNGLTNNCSDRIQWQGVSKFGKRAYIFSREWQEDSVLLIRPIQEADNQSQVYCRVLRDPTIPRESVTIKVTRKMPMSIELLRNESTIRPVPINGTFRAVCSFRNIDARVVHWIVETDHVSIGKIVVRPDECRTYLMITTTPAVDRMQFSCNLSAQLTTFSVQRVGADDHGTEVYCSAIDRYGFAVRSDSVSIKTQVVDSSENALAKIRPAYREATLVASCPFGNGTENVLIVHPATENGNGSEMFRTRSETDFTTFIRLDRNCTVIDYALHSSRRFYVGCDPDSKSLTLVIDPVYGNASDSFRVTCAWYASLPSSNTSSTPELKMMVHKRQYPQVVYPVSKPTLHYSGGKIQINETEPDISSMIWLVPALPDQELEFSCSFDASENSTFNLSLYIQIENGEVFRFLDRRKPNGTNQKFVIRGTFRVMTSYRGVFCVAENIVSRWESDSAGIKLRNASVFMALHDRVPSNSSFFLRHLTPTRKLCYDLCEVYGNCHGVSYQDMLCSLSNHSFQDLQFVSNEGFSFYHRLPPEDILQKQDFWSSVYIKHENRMLPFHEDLEHRTGVTATQCQYRCTANVLCRSIQYNRALNICHLSRLKPTKNETTAGIDRFDWDVYTRTNTPDSFVVIRELFPDKNYHPVSQNVLTGLQNDQDQLKECADSCRNNDHCLSFVSIYNELGKHMTCFLYGVNIPEMHLVKPVKNDLKRRFYVRVKSVNFELVPVKPRKMVTIA